MKRKQRTRCGYAVLFNTNAREKTSVDYIERVNLFHVCRQGSKEREKMQSERERTILVTVREENWTVCLIKYKMHFFRLKMRHSNQALIVNKIY